MKDIFQWIANNVCNFDDDFDVLEFEMMESMYMNCMDAALSQNSKEKNEANTNTVN